MKTGAHKNNKCLFKKKVCWEGFWLIVMLWQGVCVCVNFWRRKLTDLYWIERNKIENASSSDTLLLFLGKATARKYIEMFIQSNRRITLQFRPIRQAPLTFKKESNSENKIADTSAYTTTTYQWRSRLLLTWCSSFLVGTTAAHFFFFILSDYIRLPSIRTQRE